MPEITTPKLIHVARFQPRDGRIHYLFLRQQGPKNFVWFEKEDGLNSSEKETSVSGPTIEEAMRLAHRFWKDVSFRTLVCGFRYTLPERDEHGINALFHQMLASYKSPTGIYFDEELGHNCIVQRASSEALEIGKILERK